MRALLTDVETMRKQDSIYKYVRMESGEIRFVEISAFTPDHAQMIDRGEKPIPAGYVKVDPAQATRRVEVTSYGSSTLQIAGAADDESAIEQFVFGPQ